MKQQFDQSVDMELDEYQEYFFHKTMAEIEDPVLSPYTGHIYDRIDMMNWLSGQGAKAGDPITHQPLTEQMLVSGLFVKKIAQEGENKLIKFTSASDDRFTLMFNTMSAKFDSYDADISSLKKENEEFRAENDKCNEKIDKLTTEVEGLTLKVDKLKNKNKTLKSQLKESKEREDQLTEENENLHNIIDKSEKHLLWSAYGAKIDDKLQKGSTPLRHEALMKYKERVKNASNEKELKQAVNNFAELSSEQISTPRFFQACVLESATTRVAREFKNEVNHYKGW